MSKTKNVTGPCQACGMELEFPADSLGTTAKCPYCRKETELVLAVPPAPSGLPKKVILLSVASVVILLILLLGSLAALKRAERLAEERRGAAPTQSATNTPAR